MLKNILQKIKNIPQWLSDLRQLMRDIKNFKPSNIDWDFICMVFIGLLCWLLVISSIWWLPILALFFLALFLTTTLVVRYFNNRIIRQFQILNRQMKIDLKLPDLQLMEFSWLWGWLPVPVFSMVFKIEYPAMKGVYLGKLISVELYNMEEGKSPHIKIRVDTTDYGHTFNIGIEERGWSEQWFGESDILVGNISFDHRFYIESNNPEFIQQLFDNELRRIFLKNFYGTCVLENSVLEYVEETLVHREKHRIRLQNIILGMYMIGKKMDHLRHGGG